MKRRILALLIVVLLTGLTVALRIMSSPLVDSYLRTTLVEQAEKHLGVRLRLGHLERNIFLTRITLSDVVLSDLRGQGGDMSVKRLTVRLDPLATFRGGIGIRDLTLEGLDLMVIRSATGQVSVDPLFPFWERTTERDGKLAPAVKLTWGNVVLMDVDLTYLDRASGVDLHLKSVLIDLRRQRFGPAQHRRMTITARSGDLGWRAFPPGRSVSINSLRGDMTYTGRSLNIRGVDISSGPLDIRLSGSLPLDPAAGVAGDVSLTADLGQVPWLVYGGSGSLEVAGKVSGSLLKPLFTGSLRGSDISLAGRTFRDLAADIRIDQDSGRITDAVIDYGGKELSADMQVEFVSTLPFKTTVSFQDYPLQTMLREIQGFEGEVAGDVTARCELAGTLTDPGGRRGMTAALTGTVRVPVLGRELRDIALEFAGTYVGGEFAISALTASTDTLKATASGKLGREGPRVKVTVEETDLAGWLGAVEKAGTVMVQGETRGDWSEPRGEFHINVEDVNWKSYSIKGVEAQVEVDGGGISMPLGTLRVGGSRAALQGYVPWDRKAGDMFWIVELRQGALGDLLRAAGSNLRVEGSVNAHLNIEGQPGSLKANGDLDLTELSIYDEKVDRVAADLELVGDELMLPALRIVKDGRSVKGTGRVSAEGFQVELATVEPLNLDGMKSLRRLKVYLGGDLNLRLSGRGSLDLADVQATAQAQWDSITFEGRPWHGGKADFTLVDRTLTGSGLLLDGAFSAEVTVDVSRNLPFEGTIRTPGRATVEDLNDLIGIKIPEDIVSGDMVARAAARGPLVKTRLTEVEGEVTDAAFRVKGLAFQTLEPAAFRYMFKDGISFPALKLKNRDGTLTGPMRIGPGSALEGVVSGVVDLTGFSFLEPTVDSFTGSAQVDLKVAGTIQDPLLRGYLQTSDISCVAHIPFPLKVSSMTGRTEVVGDRLHFDRLKGRANGGDLVMDGDLFFSGLNPAQGDITWSGDSVQVEFPEGLTTVNRARLNLRFAEEKGMFRGSVTMDEGKYVREIDLDNMIAIIGERDEFYGSQDLTTGNGTGKGNWLALDVEMRTAAPVEVDMKLVRGTATGNLHLQGNVSRPVVVGRFEMDEGVIEYRGHTFEVNSGNVGFFNMEEVEPRFNFSGRTEVNGLDREGSVKDYTVELLAEGVPRKFKLNLVSSPPLSEVDIISLLTWGAVGEQAFATRGGLTAAEATLLLTRRLKGRLESGVERLTGFDRFVIDPSAISSSGERTTRIQVDKKLGDNMSLTYSTPVLSSEEQEVKVRYRITDNFSLVGEQKGEADYGLDLDFQFEIR